MKILRQLKLLSQPYLSYPIASYILCFLIAVLLNILIPLRAIPTFLAVYTGCFLMIMACVLFVWSFRTLKKRGILFSFLEIEPDMFIETGPYHFTRNPLFLAGIVFYAATFILLNNVWGLVTIPLLTKLLEIFILKERETRLQEQYGEEYEHFLERVARWL